MYHFKIPDDHSVGLYWYHSHIFYDTEEQVNNGMAGMILMGDILDRFPQIRHIKEVIWQLKDLQVVGPDRNNLYHIAPSPLNEADPTNRTVNGLIYPTFHIQQNEMQFWAFANLGPNIYYKLQFAGILYELVRDGCILNKLVPHKNPYLLGPSSRVGFLVIGPEPGIYNLSTIAFNTGPVGDDFPHVDLAQVVVYPSNLLKPTLPTIGFPVLKDYRNSTITQYREVSFSQDDDDNFYVNGKQFDPDRIDFEVKLGTIEKWKVINEAFEDHLFHIHQIQFQVVEVNGIEQDFVGYQDTVHLPFQEDVMLILPFDDPVIAGKFVVHCHILGHEDLGMMATVLVVE